MAVTAVDPRPYLGRSWDEQNCLALALAVLRDQGHDITYPGDVSPEQPVPPERWYALWEPVERAALRPLDVVVVKGRPLGVGVMISARDILTTRPGVGGFTCSLAAFLRVGVDGMWRLR